MKGYSFAELVKLSEAAMPRAGGSFTGAIKVLDQNGFTVEASGYGQRNIISNGVGYIQAGKMDRDVALQKLWLSGWYGDGLRQMVFSMQDGVHPQVRQGGQYYNIFHKNNLPTITDVGAAPAGFGLGGNGATVPNQDCNDAVASGFYLINAATANTPGANPGPSGGKMIVTAWGSSNVSQLYFQHASSRMYTRYSIPVSGERAWSPWSEIFSETHVPTPAEVGAVALTGGTMTGSLYLRRPTDLPEGDIGFVIDGTKQSNLYWQKGGFNRWCLFTNANGTENLELNTYNDDGTYKGKPVWFNRETMEATFLKSPLVTSNQSTLANSLTRRDYVEAELAKKLSLTGGEMTGVLSMANTGKLTLGIAPLIGAANSVILRDFNNGNVVLSAGLSPTGVAGTLYLGYNGAMSDTAGYNTKDLRVEVPMNWKAVHSLVDGDGLLNSAKMQGPIRTEVDASNTHHTIIGGSDTVNRGRTIVAAGECGKHIYDNTSSSAEQVHIGGDDASGVNFHTGLQNGWGGNTHYKYWFNQGNLYTQGMPSGPQYRFYHTGYNPTASAVGAFPITGGTLNGALTTTGVVTSGKFFVSNPGVAVMEMLIPGKHANIVYTDAAGGNLRFSQSDGATSEVTPYANFHPTALTFYKQSNFASNISAEGFITSRSALRCDASRPMVEIHSPSKVAYAMYADSTDRALRFAQTDGAGTVTKHLALITTAGDMQTSGSVYTGNGASWLATDGMVCGPVWGGDSTIATWIRGNFHPLIRNAFEIGSHVFAAALPSTGVNAVDPGYIMSGTGLRPAGAAEYSENRDLALPGTWKAMGSYRGNTDDRWDDRTTLWMRIS